MTIEEQTVITLNADLQRFVAEGKFVDGLKEFYADDVSMQENTEEACVGLAANIARVEAWMSNVKEWKGSKVIQLAVVGNVSYAETAMDYVLKDGTEVHTEQVARAVWVAGKIIDERFYHA